MPQYGQSPWADAGAGMENVGSSMARIALAQQIGRQKAQQFAQQQALERAYLQMAQQKNASEVPEIDARTQVLRAQGAKEQQDVSRQGQMDDLARAVAGNMFQKQVPGGVMNLMGGGVTQSQPAQALPYGGIRNEGASPTNVGPSMQNSEVLNQGDLVRNAVELIGMNNPAQIEQMMHGVNIPAGGVNVNELTGQQTMGQPSAAEVYSPYRQAMAQMAQDRIGMQQAQGNRRLDQQDQMNLYKIQNLVASLHKGLAEVYTKAGDLDKANEELQQANAGSGDSTSNTDAPQGKPLDATTAKELLRQAGGDKDKARQLATQAGYIF